MIGLKMQVEVVQALEEITGCRSRPSGGINTQSHIRFCSDPELFTDGRRVQGLRLELEGKRTS